MLITKKRILNLSSLSSLDSGLTIRFGVTEVDRFKETLRRIGFTNDYGCGEAILPACIGPVTSRNAEGRYIPDKEKEKETVYRTMEWTMKQWAGRGETNEVTDFVDIPYKRYPRIFIPPQSIYLSVEETTANGKIVLTPEITLCENNEIEIVHMVNLVLETFKECQVFNERLAEIMKTQLIRLDWEVLPQGEMPWEKLEIHLMPFIKKVSKSTQNVISHRMRFLNSFKPDFKAYGNAGFSGYVVFGYPQKGIFILESNLPNNATYIFEHDWKTFSKLTKAEILNYSFQKARIIHTKEADWENKVRKLFK